MFGNKLKRIIQRLNGELTLDGRTTLKALKKRGLKIGANCKIMGNVDFDSSHCWLIEIGSNVTFAPNVHILAHDASLKAYLGYTYIAKTTIGSNVFVGSGATILPGVHIGDNSIIGAGSVVTKDIPANVIAAGNPTRVIATLEAYLDKHRAKLEELPRFDETYTLNGNITPQKKQEMNNKLNSAGGYVV